ncbi:MAG: peptidoglycan bridge formation glycyltransferase FemA/FemB family protein [Patescibacteria group bacterium]
MDSNWDSQLQKLDGHFLQSQNWLKFQESLGQKLIVEKTDSYQWGGYVVDGRGGIKYLYIPYGPTLSDQNPDQALASIKLQAKEQGCMFVRFDQIQALSEKFLLQNGCKYFGEVQPRYTHMIDLSEDLASIKSRMSKTDRNLINRSEKNGTKYSISDDPKMINIFLDLMMGTAQYKNYRAKSRNYLEKQLKFLLASGDAKIYMAEYEEDIVAGVVGVDWNGTRYYMHAGANQEIIRKIPASRGLAWYMIKDAKEKGMKTFDFYGVSEPGNKTHKWASVSGFKRSFGGQDKDFGGTWDLPVSRSKYVFYRLLKTILNKA